MELSANQLYKASGSNLSFKDWLKDNQKQGVLENHEQMFNADGETEKSEDKSESKSVFRMNRNNLIGLAGLGLLIYGIHLVNKVSVEE